MDILWLGFSWCSIDVEKASAKLWQVVMDKALTVLSNFKLSSGCELEAIRGQFQRPNDTEPYADRLCSRVMLFLNSCNRIFHEIYAKYIKILPCDCRAKCRLVLLAVWLR